MHIRSGRIALLSLCVLSLFLFSGNAYACRVNDSAFSDSWRGDLNQDLNDYARILVDADSNDPNCVSQASQKLTNKLNSTPGTVWNQWLEGALVGLAFASACRIDQNGYDSPALDAALDSVHNSFTTIGRDPTCTKESVNQCVDDFLVGVPGFAWEAAWYWRKGGDYWMVYGLQLQAIGAMSSGFNEVCVQKFVSNPGDPYCNGTGWDLENPVNARTNSFNHGRRMPSYGYGLMTSVVNTNLGLIASRYPYPTNTIDQMYIARGLAREMQLYTDNNEFRWDCETSVFPDANGNFGFDYCGGPDNYSAHMYELKEAYSMFLGMPAGGFQGDTSSFDSSKFHLNPWDNDFFSWGRYVYYYTMSYDWVIHQRFPWY
jgi:hypothetical protein